ncbi:MAG TPA: hypothetical protein VGY98_14125 [Verrucomicrobiae bacterium]|nr:hypothetical protein [Verrucomicrobiae bacterium]
MTVNSNAVMRFVAVTPRQRLWFLRGCRDGLFKRLPRSSWKTQNFKSLEGFPAFAPPVVPPGEKDWACPSFVNKTFSIGAI